MRQITAYNDADDSRNIMPPTYLFDDIPCTFADKPHINSLSFSAENTTAPS
jgi:hypothetical protein